MRKIRPLTWLRLAFGSIVAVGLTFYVGRWSAGLDIGEACAAKGQIYDHVYRSDHWREPSQVFPMHNKCNADFDVVPFWVNPALVIFAALTVAFVVALVLSIVRPVKIPSR